MLRPKPPLVPVRVWATHISQPMSAPWASLAMLVVGKLPPLLVPQVPIIGPRPAPLGVPYPWPKLPYSTLPPLTQ
jgi:hypothetical protein